MPTQRKTTLSKSSDAIAILKADHDKVKKLFRDFARLHEAASDEESEAVAKQICDELTIHATVEEEIFYPEVRAAIEEDDLMNEAEVEHASAKALIAEIQSSSSQDEKWAAKVTVLGEYISHHVEEEQNEMFPRAKKAKLDMVTVGERILARKEELKGQMGLGKEDLETSGAKKRTPGSSVRPTAESRRR